MPLLPTCDRKTRAYASQKNTFGLLPGIPKRGGTCPGATLAKNGCANIPKGKKCMLCYVDPLMRAYPKIKDTLAHNTRILKKASFEKKVKLLLKEFDRFYSAELKRKNPWLNYRIHWSGDIYSENYAKALITAISQRPNLHFWIYTRSFWALPILAKAYNLTVYLSLDPVNYKEGIAKFNAWKKTKTYTKYKNVQIAYMSKEKPTFLKLVDCPVDSNKLALEGGCANCNLCVGKNPQPVWFRT